jgi:hypothetical protein
MSLGGTAKKVKPLKKAETGMSMNTASMDDESCMETVMLDGKPKRRRRSGCGKTTKFRSSGRSSGGNNSPRGRGLYTGG